MLNILQQDDPSLRKTAKEVAIRDITSPKIQKLLKEMQETLAGEYDGVGIAAPQVGESLRLFMISELLFQGRDEASKTGKAAKKSSQIKKDGVSNKKEHLVFINPEIVKTSKDTKSLEEGCLSVRPLYGMVKRSAKVTIRAYDEHGKKFERGASGLLAQIFQHEIDHLNGILFIDKATGIHEMTPEEMEAAGIDSTEYSHAKTTVKNNNATNANSISK